MVVSHPNKKKDHGLESLLALDGDTYVIHEAGYWVKFDVKRVSQVQNGRTESSIR